MSELLSIYLMQMVMPTMLPAARNFALTAQDGPATISPMGSKLRLALLLPLTALLGCGGNTSSSSSGSSTPPAQQPTYDFNGTWTAFATNYPVDLPFNGLRASLQATNGSVTGTIITYTNYALDPDPCSANNTSIAVTGTLDADNDLALSFSIAGGTGTLFAALAEDPQTYAYGAWQVVGGPCAMSATPMVISGAPTTPYTAASPTPITATLSGNWQAYANYTLPNANFQYTYPPVQGFVGVLQFANGTVSGTLTPYVSLISCGTAPSPTAVTGMIDSSNNLTLTLPVGTGTATITATLGTNPQALVDGSFKVVGGSCSMPATPMTIAQYTAVTGTYTGTFSVPDTDGAPSSGTIITLTTFLTQSSTPNSSGAYPVTGTYMVTGACTDSGSFTGLTIAGGGIGNSATPELFGSVSPSGDGVYDAFFSSTNCGGPYQGSLKRQ
jgi:hypothetical protein